MAPSPSKTALLVVSSALVHYATADTAQINLHCDNDGTGYLSRDGGATFETLSYINNWPEAYPVTVDDPDANTVFRFECHDYGVVGGFVAEVNYNDEAYLTTNDMAESKWAISSWVMDDGTTGNPEDLPLVYTALGSGAWGMSGELNQMNPNAVWVWCASYLNNHITFEFDFATVVQEPYDRNDCESDEDCGRSKHCEFNECVLDDIQCYGDDECPDDWHCDMGTYICVKPTTTSTPATTTSTPEVGCCMGDSYKANDKCANAFTSDKCESKGCSWLETDDPEDCVITTTSTVETTATTELGCCHGVDYKSHGKCSGVTDQGKCERSDKCAWLVTDDFDDCEMTTTTTSTPTVEPGCCDSDSAKSFAMCNAKETEQQCDRSSSCHWSAGATAVCEPPSTTINPGCCFGNPESAYSQRWMDACTAYSVERECLYNTDDLGAFRCHWEVLPDAYDCSMLWPTTTSTPTEMPGCCYGESYKSNDKCLKNVVQDKCESKGCSWLPTNRPEDCELTTTEPPTTTVEQGCCYGESYKANDKCMMAMTNFKCESKGCLWLVTDDIKDCEMTTTTTSTPTEESGCCKGDSYKSNAKCNEKDSSSMCSRSSSCAWIDDGTLDDECAMDTTTTETPTEPGCCYGNPEAAYSARWMTACTAFSTERDCLLLTDDLSAPRCHWEPLGEYEDCEQVWPTTTATPTEVPGCCYGESYKANDKCLMAMTSDKCASKGCLWKITDDASDCEMTTTTSSPGTTTSSPPAGCCYGDSVKSNTKCRKASEEGGCIDKDCFWMVTEDPEDCDITTTSTVETTEYTTTADEGCCKGDTVKSNEQCNLLLDEKSCGRKCDWISGGVIDVDCVVTTDAPPTTTIEVGCCDSDDLNKHKVCNQKESEMQCVKHDACFWTPGADADCGAPTTTGEPGCCYGNPEAAYSARWFETCTGYMTERECMMLTDDLDAARCFWELLGAYEDCEQTWPTTTSTPTTTSAPAGCCHGDLSSYKANDKCVGLEDQVGCERKSCTWMLTEDPEDCVVTTTTTSTPTTTMSEITTTEHGCCAGTTASNADMCNEKVGHDQCERSDKCVYRPEEDDCSWPTTTSEPWLGAQEDSSFSRRSGSYSGSRKSGSNSRNSHSKNSMLFAGENMVTDKLSTQVSLTTVLALTIGAFVVWMLFRWYSNKKAFGGYIKLADAAPASTRMPATFHSV